MKPDTVSEFRRRDRVLRKSRWRARVRVSRKPRSNPGDIHARSTREFLNADLGLTPVAGLPDPEAANTLRWLSPRLREIYKSPSTHQCVAAPTRIRGSLAIHGFVMSVCGAPPWLSCTATVQVSPKRTIIASLPKMKVFGACHQRFNRHHSGPQDALSRCRPQGQRLTLDLLRK